MYDKKKLSLVGRLSQGSPQAFAGYQALERAAFADGEIPLKYKELIAIGVAMATQCVYCLEIHGQKAREADATEAELSEVAMIAMALRAGGALTHALHAIA